MPRSRWPHWYRAAVMSISCANLFTRSIYCDTSGPAPRQGRGPGQPVVLAVHEVRGGGFLLLLNPTYSTEFQLIGGVLILQTLPAVLYGLATAWFHRGALILGMVVGLAYGTWMLYGTPQLSATGKVLVAHFGGSSIRCPSWAGLQLFVYIGVIALLANTAVAVVGTLVLSCSGCRPAGMPRGRRTSKPTRTTSRWTAWTTCSTVRPDDRRARPALLTCSTVDRE